MNNQLFESKERILTEIIYLYKSYLGLDDCRDINPNMTSSIGHLLAKTRLVNKDGCEVFTHKGEVHIWIRDCTVDSMTFDHIVFLQKLKSNTKILNWDEYTHIDSCNFAESHWTFDILYCISGKTIHIRVWKEKIFEWVKYEVGQ